MKKPKTPPSSKKMWEKLAENPDRFSKILEASTGPTINGKYLHWDELLRRTPPDGLNYEEWWFALKLNRNQLYKSIHLIDQKGESFKYAEVEPIPERLHVTAQVAGGQIHMPDEITNPETRDRYYVSSLIEEAINSSQLEGASTTRKVAKDMLRSGRDPRDKDERMILNNFITMRRIGELKKERLTKDLVFEVHRLVTSGTLDNEDEAGRFRIKTDGEIIVANKMDEIFYTPPPCEQLEERMKAMCAFANAETPSNFVNPVIRSIILHFWLSYDHPFTDGNGRTARALFYWSMLHHEYWLFEFVSISKLIRRGPSKYARAFLHTEMDENDLTYFILYHLDVIRRAIDALHEYIRKETKELRELERELAGVSHLNHRQRALISHALRHPGQIYSFESHAMSHGVVYETGRKDILGLGRRGLLREIGKTGRTRNFTPAVDLEEQLRALS